MDLIKRWQEFLDCTGCSESHRKVGQGLIDETEKLMEYIPKHVLKEWEYWDALHADTKDGK